MSAIDRARAEHYTWGGVCDGWHLLKAGGLSVIEERIPPGGSEVRHFHERAHQFFYVLKGVLSFELDGKDYSLHPRQGLEVKPGTPHRVFNRGTEDAEFIVVSHPPSHADRVTAEQTFA
ncbi:MAG: cupin domain-containing protein [Rhodospirillaceae bacterium]|nr:cupin domain-containing protein [Rhodospirillaceae bacterium]